MNTTPPLSLSADEGALKSPGRQPHFGLDKTQCTITRMQKLHTGIQVPWILCVFTSPSPCFKLNAEFIFN